MKDKNQQTSDALERATKQLDNIEQLITLLMDGIKFDDLKMSERLNIATKLMAQHTRTLKLREDLNGEHDASSDEAFLTNLRLLLGGASSDQTSDNPLPPDENTNFDTLDKDLDLFLLDQKIYPYYTGEDL